MFQKVDLPKAEGKRETLERIPKEKLDNHQKRYVKWFMHKCLQQPQHGLHQEVFRRVIGTDIIILKLVGFVLVVAKKVILPIYA